MWEGLRLRDLINQRLDALEAELKAIRLSLEKMAHRTISASEFDNLKFQVASLAEGLNELEARIGQLEQHNSIVRWIVRQVVTIVIILFIVSLIGWLR